MKKQKKNLFFVFDKLPNIKDGGLLATYIRLNELLGNVYNIKILSIFDYGNSELFKDNQKIIAVNKNIDLDFVHVFKYIKTFKLKKILKCFKDGLIYFTSIHKARKNVRNLISDDDLVIVTCPSAAIFMPSSIEFILEIHIKFDFFYGKNIMGRMQSSLMQKPTLTLFRTKADMLKAKKHNMKNVDYIYNFFDNDKINKVKDIKTNRLCYVGRLSPQKDLKRMLDNAILLKKYNKDFILDIYGDGEDKEMLEKYIKENKLEDTVTLKGFTSDKEIYKNYSALWLTSKYEGFALVIIEAKANGIPTISTNWGDGVFEGIENNVDGYISNDDNELVSLTNDLITNKEKLKQFSNKAYESFQKFSKETAKKRWITILNNYKNKK